MAFHIFYDFRTVFKLQTVLILTVVQTLANTLFSKKENCQMGNYGKFGKKLPFIELYSFFVDLLAFELGKLCPGVGTFVSFFCPGGRCFALKSCPGGGDLDGKNIVARRSARGGMVTGQIDTCIRTLVFCCIGFIKSKL